MKVGQTALHKKPNQDDSLIPLINIVFLMLIFFMVAGHIGESEPLKVQPPRSVSDKHQAPEQRVIIIGADGRIAFGQEFVTKEALPAAISEQFDQTADDEKQAFSLLVKVDGELPVDQLKEVLSIIKQSGIKRVSLATQKTPEAP
jgi:biopolymer transport protein ExbD